MKKLLIITALLSSATFATNYSTMTTEQLQSMKGNIPSSERNSFRSEVQKRMANGTMQKGMMQGKNKGTNCGTNMQKGNQNKLY